MPVWVEVDRVPDAWKERSFARSPSGSVAAGSWHPGVRIALINNMPDGALEDTELQFFELLEAASGSVPVSFKLFSLPGIERTGRGESRLSSFYSSIDELWDGRFDAVIMTGTEPHSPTFPEEPYWPVLPRVLEWAEENTLTTVLSCLAAHAGVLYSDGIPRRALSAKRCGVFDSTSVDHVPLISGAPAVMRFPHSRWNEVPEDALKACGYAVLTRSTEAGVDLFAKKKKRSLFVHFQGHPEYGAYTLLKEYRRDVKRYLNHERDTYPALPQGYFNNTFVAQFTAFQDRAIADRRESLMACFPDSTVTATLRRTWQLTAVCIYSNWLQYIVAGMARLSKPVDKPRAVVGRFLEKQPAVP